MAQKTGTALVLVLACGFIATPTGEARADRTVNANEPQIWFDDIYNRQVEIVFPSASGGSDAPADVADAGGKSNNGHGNNADGVDSSNPGQGKGGPNAAGADSDPSVDDESGGGGASPSKGKKK